MDDYIAVYLYDVKRAIERKTEIMREAINRILKIQHDFPLPNAKAVIDTRNRIIHGYDSVKPDFFMESGYTPYSGTKKRHRAYHCRIWDIA